MNGTLKHPIPEKAPAWIGEIMNQCFEIEPEKRPTMKQILTTLDEHDTL
jgi:hypothetical protein